MILGDITTKRTLGHYQEVYLASETVCFANSVVIKGNAKAIALAVGDFASASPEVLTEELQEDNDLLENHFNVLQISICVLIMASTLLLIHCAISIDISWEKAGNIAALMFVYGFPYMLAIPAIWDIALRNTAKHFLAGNV